MIMKIFGIQQFWIHSIRMLEILIEHVVEQDVFFYHEGKLVWEGVIQVIEAAACVVKRGYRRSSVKEVSISRGTVSSGTRGGYLALPDWCG